MTDTPTPIASTQPLVATLARHRIVPVIRHHDADAAHEIARACVAGGLGLVEITLTTPDACAIIADLAQDAPDNVTIGAGTVLDSDQVADATAAGAAFLVSPVTDPDVMAVAAAAGVPLIPGAATPSEIAWGARLGAPVVKVFPAGGLGLTFLRSVRAVMPDLPLLPSGGIAMTDVPKWLDAGAAAVAIGSDLNAAHAKDGVDGVTALAAMAADHQDPDNLHYTGPSWP